MNNRILSLSFGFSFEDLYSRDGLVRLDAQFLSTLAEASPELHTRLLAVRENPADLALKPSSELLIEEYRNAYGLQAIINRCGVLTGPWQMGKVDQGVFVLWMAAHYFGKPLSYIGYGGTGKQVRDLLHIDDLLNLIKYQLDHFDNLDGQVLNVGGGRENSLSLLETTQLCEQITGKSILIQPVPNEREGDVPIFITDSSQISKLTGWIPKKSPMETLEDIYKWIGENEEQLASILK